jgi:hypothetical protein
MRYGILPGIQVYERQRCLPDSPFVQSTKGHSARKRPRSGAPSLTPGQRPSARPASLGIAPIFSDAAIYSQGGTVQISNSTFGNNPENIGGGGALSNAGSSVLIQNSIVANSANGGNCAGTITSDGYNLSSDSTCNFSNLGDLNSQNPKLGALHKNGGPTETMALPKGSLALDAGNPAGCRDFSGNLLKTDQRGRPRPGGGETTGCDMGAYESQTY